MAWQVVMDDNGIIALPPDLMDELRWTPGTHLRWIEGVRGVMLERADGVESEANM